MTDAVEKVRLFKDAAGEWRFTAVAGNGEPVATSEGYVDKRDALAEAAKLFPGAEVEDVLSPEEAA